MGLEHFPVPHNKTGLSVKGDDVTVLCKDEAKPASFNYHWRHNVSYANNIIIFPSVVLQRKKFLKLILLFCDIFRG